MTESESVKIVAMLNLAFPKGAWSAEFQQLFAERVRDLDFCMAKRATLSLIESATFPPAIAEFRHAVMRQIVGPRRPALDAWADVRKAIARVGALYGSDDKPPSFKHDAAMAYVVSRMGWDFICTTDTPDGVLEKRFCDFYEAVQDNGELLLQLSQDARPQLNPQSAALKQLIEGIGKGAT